MLNHKRGTLVELESRFGLTITIEADDAVGAQHYAIFRGALAEKPEGFVEVRSLPTYVEPEEPEDEIVVEEEDEAPVQAEQPRHPQQQQPRSGEDGEGRDRKRRKRRRRRGGKDRDREHGDREHGAPAEGAIVSVPADTDAAVATDETTSEGGEAPVGAVAVDASDDGQGKKRRRGKRGGKRNRREDGEDGAEGSRRPMASKPMRPKAKPWQSSPWPRLSPRYRWKSFPLPPTTMCRAPRSRRRSAPRGPRKPQQKLPPRR
ncbi:hypothetical protein AJ88_33455 [Mesorhizobium amorphae CCBAU 01583]|nr:hypothetical protein AJ88_33455 [Mesorhizobium amorphae CCBAU 01583]